MTAATTVGKLVRYYAHARGYLIGRGFGSEIAWQDSVSLERTTESDFLREAAWVVLAAGMKETVIRQKFPAVSRAFLQWRSAQEIDAQAMRCRESALAAFKNIRKIEAILQICSHVARTGFSSVRESITADGITYIRRLPFMGPATAYHLAKNIGVPCAKPDRHLVRMAAVTGFASVQAMCDRIAVEVGEKVSVVDLVLWRYATCTPNYLNLLRAAGSI